MLERPISADGFDFSLRPFLSNIFYSSHRSNFETLQHKQRVLKNIEEDLGSITQTMHEAENYQEKIQAELDLTESNRYQVQKVGLLESSFCRVLLYIYIFFRNWNPSWKKFNV